jgi:hypothetical protein
MGFMKQNKMEKSGVWEGKEEAYEEFACKTCKKHNSKAAAQKCPDCGKPMDECTCEK